MQAAIEAAWHEITAETVRVTAAGRTDAGVHALGQVVAVATDSRLPVSDLQRGLNAVLPEDVAVVALEEAEEGFHATYDASVRRIAIRFTMAACLRSLTGVIRGTTRSRSMPRRCMPPLGARG